MFQGTWYPPTPAPDYSLIIHLHHEDGKNWNPQWLSPWVPPLPCLQVPSGAPSELEGHSQCSLEEHWW